MKSFQRLYDEMQLGERPDLAGRIAAKLASFTGAFRRLPAHEMTSDEFARVFVPGRFENTHDFLATHAAFPAPWKEIPASLIPDSLVAAADQAVEQKFSFLGSSFHFQGDVDWHHSLGPGGSWPRAPWAEIPFMEVAHLGDIRPCWEMNRHQFFVTLALAWIKTGDAKYPAAIKRFLNSWCDQNTPETGINYISGFEMGLRCVSWLFADKLLRGCPDWDETVRERLHRNVYAQARHISEYISFDARASGNHNLLGEAATLVWIALQYPEWQESPRWLKRGLNVLWPALDMQVSPDGVYFEVSPACKEQVMELLALVFTEMRRQKRPLPSKSYIVLGKMASVLRPLQQPDGAFPNINDNDDGHVVPLCLPQRERIAGLMTVMTVLYERPDFKASAAETYPLFAQLLLGESGAEEFRMIAEIPETFPFVTDLRHGGLYILRKKGDWLLLKNNPDSYPQSGHNHADLLSLLLCVDGKPLLVDAGTYRYNDERGIRNALRSTAAHNTVTVDRQGQSEPLRNFGWSRPLTPGFSQAYEEADFAIIDAQHDSYHGLGVTHRRVVIWFKADDTIVVVDQLQGEGAHRFDQHWHFAPGTRIKDAGGLNYQLSDGGGEIAWLRFLRDKEQDQHEILAGSDGNPAFYYSRHYGELEPGVVLRHSWAGELNATHGSHRIAVFSKKQLPVEFGDVWNAEFLFNGWTIDLTQTPAKVTKSKI